MRDDLTKPSGPTKRPGRVLTTIFAVVMGLTAVGLVFAFVAKFKSGTAFQRYKNWQGIWVSYGDLTVFAVVIVVVGMLGVLYSWFARRREERSMIEKYRRGK